MELYDCEVFEERTDAPAKPAAKARETITATNVLIATGSVARDLPFAKFDNDKIWGAREAMFNKAMPKSLIVVGAGAIGIEFGYFYNSFGTKVTIIEMMDRILPVEDEDISKAMDRVFRKHGMDIRTSTLTTAIDKSGPGVKVTVSPVNPATGKPDETKKEVLEADKVLLAIGVKGRFDGLFDPGAGGLGLEVVKDSIKTDYNPGKFEPQTIDYKTNIEGLYAIGDVIGPPWLAHVASEEAILCVERIAWKAKNPKMPHEPIPIDYSVIPGCTYCHPQVASVGYTEQALKKLGKVKDKDYAVGTFPFTALGKAIATRSTDGFAKIIRGLPRGETSAAHLMGDQATELISELTLARRLEATTEEIICSMHAHPTMHEATREAAAGERGKGDPHVAGTPRMAQPRPVEVKPLAPFRIWLRFSDGAEGIVDLSHLAGLGVFRAWDEPGFFELAFISQESRTVTWPGELDLDPDVLYSQVTGKALPGQGRGVT